MVGTQFGPYRIVRPLGEGGMGTVYEAVHQQLGRRVAVKIMRPEYARDPDALNRLFNEARAVNLIEHPALVQVSEFGQLPDGSAYLVMDLIKGDTLNSRLRRAGGKLAEKVGLSIAAQLASALMAAHEKRIVHRDLKPANVMLIPDAMVHGGERVKLLDFGIAKLLPKNTLEGDAQTRTGIFMGTPRYMSPEQCRGNREIDGKSDVYSLGIMLYEMLSGALPYVTQTEAAFVAAHLIDDPIPLREVAPNVSSDICALIDRMLRKKKEERPSMLEVAKAIGEHAKINIEELATARISSLPDLSVLRAMIKGPLAADAVQPTVAAVRRGGPPPPPPPSNIVGPLIPVPLPSPASTSDPMTPTLNKSGGPGDSDAGHTAYMRSPSSNTQPSPPPPSRARYIALFIVIALLPIGIALLFLARPKRTAQPPVPARPAIPEKPPAPKIHWSIVSDPSGAEVVRDADGLVLGTTPFEKDREAKPGIEKVRVRRDGYREILLTLAGDRDISVDRSLTANPPPPPVETVQPVVPVVPVVKDPPKPPPKKVVPKKKWKKKWKKPVKK